MKKSIIKTGLLLGLTSTIGSLVPFSNSYAAVVNNCIIFDSSTQTITSYSKALECTKDVVIPVQINGVDVLGIGTDAFRSMGLKSITFEGATDGTSKLKTIGLSSFSSNYIKGELILPQSTVTVEDGAFGGNWFTKVVLNEGLTFIGNYAFSNGNYGPGAGMGNVTLPKSLTTLGSWAFWLTNAKLTVPIEVYNATGNFVDTTTGNLYKKTQVTLQDGTKMDMAELQYVSQSTETVTIPNTVTTPDGKTLLVQGVGSSQVVTLSQETNGQVTLNFDGTLNSPISNGVRLNTIVIDPELTRRTGIFVEDNKLLRYETTSDKYNTQGELPYDKTRVQLLRILSTQDNNNLVLKSQYGSGNLVETGNGSMWNFGITNITLPEGLESIMINSLHANKLTSITIPSSVKKLEYVALKGNNLTNVNWNGHISTTDFSELPPDSAGNKQYFYKGGVYTENSDGTLTYSYNANVNITDLVIPSVVPVVTSTGTVNKTVSQISTSDYSNNTYSSVTIPGTIVNTNTNLGLSGDGPFIIKQLKTVTLNEGTTTIGRGTFSANNLRTVNLPSTITKIEDQAFTANWGVPLANYMVVGIVPDGFDKTKITNNEYASNLRILTQSEALAILDTTPPDYTLTQGTGSTSEVITVSGINSPKEKLLYKIINPTDTCVTDINQANLLNYTILSDSIMTLSTFDSGQKLCTLGVDDSFNVTPKSLIISTIDKTKPVITIPSDFSTTAGTTLPYDILTGVSVSDNIDTLTPQNLNVSVVGTKTSDGKLDLSKVGTYTVTYNVTDNGGNIADPKVLTITVKENDKTNLITAIDNANTQLSTTPKNIVSGSTELTKAINDANIVKNDVNATPQQIIDSINSLNTAINNLVRDTEKPIISVPSNQTYTVGQIPTYTILDNVSVTDNYDKTLTPQDITVQVQGKDYTGSTLDVSNVGTYTITYSVTDNAGNISDTKTVVLNIIEANKTELQKLLDTANSTLNTNTDKIVSGKQQLQDAITNGTSVVSNIKSSDAVIKDAIDTLTSALNGLVKDMEKPIISVPSNQTISVGSVTMYDTLTGVTVTDNLDKTLTNSGITVTLNGTVIDSSKPLDISKVGTYTLTYDIQDSVGNPADQKTVVLTVTSPDKTQLQELLKVAELNLNTDINKIINGKDPLTNDIQRALQVINDPNASSQQINDAFKALTTSNTNLVKDLTSPVIIVPQDKTIQLGTTPTYNVLSGVSVSDNIDKTLTNSGITVKLNGTVIDPSKPLDISKVGTYTLTYDIKDSVGNPSETKTVKINVVTTITNGAYTKPDYITSSSTTPSNPTTSNNGSNVSTGSTIDLTKPTGTGVTTIGGVTSTGTTDPLVQTIVQTGTISTGSIDSIDPRPEIGDISRLENGIEGSNSDTGTQTETLKPVTIKGDGTYTTTINTSTKTGTTNILLTLLLLGLLGGTGYYYTTIKKSK